MPELVTKVVAIFTAFRDGREQGFEVDRDVLVRKFRMRGGSTRASVVESEDAVGVVDGRLFKWWEEPGNPGGTKLHWTCPRCGQHQWGDWRPEMPNPCVWYSDCPCIGKWMIDWSLPTDNKVGLSHQGGYCSVDAP